MIYLSAILQRRRRRRLYTCLFFCNKLRLCVADRTIMIHTQKQRQSIRVPKSICDLSEDVLMSGLQFPGETKFKLLGKNKKLT
jgi:hypothetical protein